MKSRVWKNKLNFFSLVDLWQRRLCHIQTDCVNAVEFILSTPSISFCAEDEALAVWDTENSVCEARSSVKFFVQHSEHQVSHYEFCFSGF